jgi:hypothetical protein
MVPTSDMIRVYGQVESTAGNLTTRRGAASVHPPNVAFGARGYVDDI